MARFSYIPEKEKPEPRYGKGDRDFKPSRFDPEDPEDRDDGPRPEMASVLDFVQDKMDNDERTFTGDELQELFANLHRQDPVEYRFYQTVRDELLGYGLKLAGPQVEKSVRTFGENPNNLWSHPSMNTGARGGGGSSIQGFAGRVG